MDVSAFLKSIEQHPQYAGQISHVQQISERAGQLAQPRQPLHPGLADLLRGQGIEQLYQHQVSALETARAGQDLVVVTGTASGKTLCYNLPILEACLNDPKSRALYLFPTKALAQDQLKGQLELLAGNEQLSRAIKPGVFDGDTPTAQRRRIKAESNLVLSNPDMLHASILPYHPKWNRFFGELKYVVLDEVHTYRGILGAHVACVLRRLMRVCEHYGSRPVVLAASATIANPGELTSRLIGRDVQVIDNDGSPRGRKYFVLWNPSPDGRDHLARRSATDDAVWLMVEAMRAGGQALTFTRTRQAAELVNRYAQNSLRDQKSELANRVRAYRGGYLPKERRQIEQDLFQGELRGVSTTNALELGVDIGSLDVALLVNYPGTVASTWQQAGRSGRRHDESLAVLLAGNDPVDQYLLRHPHYFFDQSPEHAVVDPENSYVLANHLKAAAFELPLEEDSAARFGASAPAIAEILCQAHELSQVAGKSYFAGGQNPAHQISLRHMSDETFSIILRRPKSDPRQVGLTMHVSQRPLDGPHDLGPGRDALDHANEVIANVDAISAPELIYPQAVYLHNGETYFIRELDLEGKVAYAERHEMDYYTQAVLESNVLITAQRTTNEALTTAELAYGNVDVSWKTVAFKKIKFSTRENVGFGSVDIPAQNLPTTAFWLVPDDQIRLQLKSERLRTSEGLCGLRNLAVEALPMIAMCDSRDISGVVDSKNLGKSSLILYDRYPGGLGYSEKGFHQIQALLELCHEMVAECECEEGCPSCVGLPNLRPAIHSDPDLLRGYPMPNKLATTRLLQLLLTQSDNLPTQPVVKFSTKMADLTS
ncbi:MAG: DEAD/DEAH box helicase [Planctomycetaceae bacterium]|nr:DEAD/DEAH box helicase [Planctomycetaceae bacterium]